MGSVRSIYSRLSIPRLRLATGLIVGVYVTLHLLNHAMGIISLNAQEVVRPYVMALWQSLVGQVILYGSLIFHAGLGLYAFGRRRSYRIPAWEAVQLTLGLAIPALLLDHIIGTRITTLLTGMQIDYPHEITNLWVDPISRTLQVSLVLVVWIHFALGLHFWLRMQAWYRKAFAVALLVYVLIPLTSLLGFAESGKLMTEYAQRDPKWYAEMLYHGIPADPARAKLRAALKTDGPWVWLGIVGAVFCYAQGRNWLERRRVFVVTYGEHQVRAPIGMSLLEASRMARRPHLSVCGGRARCTTCRVRILQCDGKLPEPTELEAEALARIGAPADVRLACQTRPTCNIVAHPLLDPRSHAIAHAAEFGKESDLTVLFVDLRGSTRMAEKQMPFDVVFVVNQFMAEMTAALVGNGGYYSNFTGDGLMALFGLKQTPEQSACDALRCALQMLQRLNALNDRLTHQITQPMEIGIGIHSGLSIVGRMGPPQHPVLTALGDTINVAARLQDSTKQLGLPVAISADAFDRAGWDRSAVQWKQLTIRGRAMPLLIAGMNQAGLESLLADRVKSK